ncbi:hypothetical protein D927_01404, partial [Enterococcus faecalis 02-MB-BW-10]
FVLHLNCNSAIKKRTNFRMFLLTKLAENDMIKGGEKEGKR